MPLLLCATALLCACNPVFSQNASPSFRGAAVPKGASAAAEAALTAEMPVPNLWGAISRDTHLSIFASIVGNAGMVDLFADQEYFYTVLAPSDDAFKHVNWKKLIQNKERCAVIGGGYYLDTMLNKQFNTLLERVQPLRITPSDRGHAAKVWGMGNAANVVSADTNAWNGYLHSIDNVLEFDGPLLGSQFESAAQSGSSHDLVDVINTPGYLTTFARIVKESGMEDELRQSKLRTVLAPATLPSTSWASPGSRSS
eukprot:GDKI01008613.1.p1 GENE.GDKI01008613.1~~GDKI01008613.1.p1  ORF type:complete len:255 (-),score=61.61 GDKI01008613.1:549-1313(-)